VKSRVIIALTASAGLTLTSCEYVWLLRPSVLKQLNPRVVRLVNEFPEVDRPNEAIVTRFFAHGGLSRADHGNDGVFRTRIYAPRGQYLWYPSVIVMESVGDLEVEFSNDDEITHAVLMPGGAGDHAMAALPVHQGARARPPQQPRPLLVQLSGLEPCRARHARGDPREGRCPAQSEA
jgi:hypothetical protein